jgi:CMP-N-acetylneuraminic acid synthetase
VPLRVAAIVPMRHESERVPGKNFRAFAGRPLYHYIIDSLQACSLVSEILIDTDSQIIAKDAAQHFPSVRVVERPAHLRHGNTPMNDVLLHSTTHADADLFLQTHSTNPLLTAATIGGAIEALATALPTHDSLFSVTRLQTRLWDGLTRPVNHNPAILLRTQDLPPVYEENSCLYIFDRASLLSEHNRIGKRPLMFEIARIEASDIDEELDFLAAEFHYQQRALAGSKGGL